jgi:hypothetical protein
MQALKDSRTRPQNTPEWLLAALDNAGHDKIESRAHLREPEAS